jgi:ribose 5-phosphate isomerase A
MTDGMTRLGERALEYVTSGATVGLGTGRAATAFVRALGAKVKQGLRVRGVATSRVTAQLAAELGIPLVELAGVERIDVTVDGADEVSPTLDLIKGWGGALVREKIVAAASSRLVILVGSEKVVPVLGTRGKLPVEVVPFGLEYCARRFKELGLAAEPRRAAGGGTDPALFVTDNGNRILDCAVAPIEDPERLEAFLLATPGVVGTGLFLRMAETVLVSEGEEIRVMRRGT